MQFKLSYVLPTFANPTLKANSHDLTMTWPCKTSTERCPYVIASIWKWRHGAIVKTYGTRVNNIFIRRFTNVSTTLLTNFPYSVFQTYCCRVERQCSFETHKETTEKWLNSKCVNMFFFKRSSYVIWSYGPHQVREAFCQGIATDQISRWRNNERQKHCVARTILRPNKN